MRKRQFLSQEIFQNRVMDRLHRLFKIKSEEVAEFQYIGLNIKKNRYNVKLGKVKKKDYITKLFNKLMYPIWFFLDEKNFSQEQMVNSQNSYWLTLSS